MGLTPRFVDSLQVDSLQGDSCRVDSLEVDSLEVDSLQVDSLQVDSLQVGGLEVDDLEVDGLEVGGLEMDSMEMDSMQVGPGCRYNAKDHRALTALRSVGSGEHFPASPAGGKGCCLASLGAGCSLCLLYCPYDSGVEVGQQ